MEAAIIILIILMTVSLICNATLWVLFNSQEDKLRSIRKTQYRQDKLITILEDDLDSVIDYLQGED